MTYAFYISAKIQTYKTHTHHTSQQTKTKFYKMPKYIYLFNIIIIVVSATIKYFRLA